MFIKKSILACFSLVLAATLVQSAQAINLGRDLTQKAAVRAGYDQNTTDTSLAENIGSVVKIILSLTGIIFTGLMVYAGMLWMTARGDEAKVDKAQEIIRAAIIGLAITLGAYSITEFVVPRILLRFNGDQ